MKHRTIKYKGYFAYLTPNKDQGIRGEVRDNSRPRYKVLYVAEADARAPGIFDGGELSQARTSLQSAKIVLADCKHWIDRRVELEQALDDL